jgi:hypothetical protein
MSTQITVFLDANAAQTERLDALQQLFAKACNAVAPVVRETRCWNRVALHHMVYKALRERFPELGSQMACNVIYSVSRSARLIYQHPQSPWALSNEGESALPLLNFLPSAPVYFDRHTLSLKDGQVSLFTLDGRMRFQIRLQPADEQRFHEEKLREIVLQKHAGRYALRFEFVDKQEGPAKDTEEWAELPEYLVVLGPDALTQTQPPALLRAS